MSFLTSLWSSVFTPGTNTALITATHASFGALQATLAALLFATRSWHFVFLSILCGGLWAGITWFVRELETMKALEREAERLRKEREGSGEGEAKKEQ